MEYVSEFNKKSSFESNRSKLVGLLISILFIFAAIVFIVLDQMIFVYLSFPFVFLFSFVLVVIVPKILDKENKQFLKMKPFLKMNDLGIVHDGVLVKWSMIRKIAVIGEVEESFDNTLNDNERSINEMSSRVIFLLDAKMCENSDNENEKDMNKYSSPLFVRDNDMLLLKFDLTYLSNVVDFIEKLRELTVDKNLDVLYTGNEKEAELFLNDDNNDTADE